LYRDAKNAELIAEQGETVNQAAIESAHFQKQLESLYDNPFDDSKFNELEDDQFEDEVNNLIEWCEDLDFDKYCDSWHTMATSAKPMLPSDDNHVQVLGLGMGDITIGLGSPNATASQEIPGLNNLVDMHASADSKLMSGLSNKHEEAAKAGMDSLAYSNQVS